MTEDFQLPPGMVGRFAVVKLWPEIRTAEDECIARLKIAARALGLECFEVHADGRMIGQPDITVSPDSVDFVLHLHYDTPKLYDAFSFVALWNPLYFYHWWGYERTSRNLTTHDDFVSCMSPAADDHVRRMIRHSDTHLAPTFRLFHSTADVVHAPSLGDQKLFYVGINWEAMNGGKSRHQEVLKRLDGTGLLRIYGPTIFQGTRVWDGYQSYVKEVPFDGVSMIDEISRAGIALVLSSQAHRDSELMSNRLFESVAAGALVICDENPFAARHFGDSLLYIDSRSTEDQIEQDIRAHLQWARDNPEQALEKIARAQAIFREKFTLIRNLGELYRGLPGRKRALAELRNPPQSQTLRVRACMLMPNYSPAVLAAHLQSVRVQDYPALQPQLVIDSGVDEATREAIRQEVSASGLAVELVEAEFESVAPVSGIRTQRRLGQVLQELLPQAQDADAVIFVADNERLISEHVSVLAGALQRDPEVHCAATAAVLLEEGTAPVVHELLDFGFVNPRGPTGYGRFIFRVAGIPEDIGSALPHLHGRPLAVLLGDHVLAQQMQASIRIYLQHVFPSGTWDEAAETAVIRDYSAEALRLRFGFGPRPARQALVPSAPPAVEPAPAPAPEPAAEPAVEPAAQQDAEPAVEPAPQEVLEPEPQEALEPALQEAVDPAPELEPAPPVMEPAPAALAPAPPMRIRQVMRMSLNVRWVFGQIWLLCHQGPRARWSLLRRKLGRS